MPLTRQEITDYAMHYVAREEITEFPMDGDLFCMLQRKLPENRILKDDEGWQFAGYHVCLGYMLDDEAKPVGKWMWMQHVSLASFPPKPGTLKLQPPHIAKGMYQDPGRTTEFRMVRLDMGLPEPAHQKPNLLKHDRPGDAERETGEAGKPGNILAFPIRRVKKSPGGDDPGSNPGRSA